jgi:hypothetical protein
MHFRTDGSLFGRERWTEPTDAALADGVEEPKKGGRVRRCSDIMFTGASPVPQCHLEPELRLQVRPRHSSAPDFRLSFFSLTELWEK